jgi:tetratricopeptide (TPR) repeat protein
MDDETRGPGPEGPFDPFDVFADDLDDEAFLEAWAEAERDAAEVLVEGLVGSSPVLPGDDEVAAAADGLRDAHRRGDPAAVWMLRSAGIRDPRATADEDLLIRAVAATITMIEDPELPAEEAAAIMSLELGDWVGAILGLVRAGPGSRADADVLVRHIETVEEVEGPPFDEDDRLAIEHAFLLVLPAWEVAGAVEASYVAGTTLTRLGAWLLPTAAVHAWTLDADAAITSRPPLRLVEDTSDGRLEPSSEPDTPDADVAEVYGLEEQGADALRILTGALDLFEREEREDLPEDTAADLLHMLTSEPSIAEALAHTQLGVVGAGAAGLERLARLLRPHARGRTSAPLELLDAKAAEARGDALAGEAALRRALQADPAYEPAHEDLAWYLEDRGDRAGALRHLRQASIPNDDEQVQRLTELQAIRPAVGRNDPCPCGSGLKYKRCCERTGGPLPDRVSALFDKMSNYLARPLQRGALMALVEARAGDATDDHRLVAAMGDPLLFDVALFEGEWLEDFLEERGQLLPADERDLAASWVGLPRSLYEIVAVRPGEELELLDLRCGERVVVRERTASTQLRTGEAIFVRVVPDGVGHQLAAGTMLIPAQQRDRLLGFLDTRPSAIEICGWIAALEAPPTLLTMEGEPTVFCTAEYRVADPDQARTVLTDRYEADPDGAMFVDWVEVDGRRWGRGTIELDGDRLVIQTNAEPRLDRFEAVVEELVAGAELLDESRRAASELVDGHDTASVASPGSVGPSFDELPEEVRSVLEAEIRRHEERWVDESIPMFGGLTPRQALDDPTRRPQLLAFLDELGEQETPGAMSARRIRRLLGLGLV